MISNKKYIKHGIQFRKVEEYTIPADREIQLSNSGNYFIYLPHRDSSEYSLNVWNLNQGKPQAEIEFEEKPSALAFSNSNETIAVSLRDKGSVEIWNKHGELIKEIFLEGITDSGVSTLSFSNDGKEIAVGHNDGFISIFNTNPTSTNALIKNWKGHRGKVEAISFHPERNEILTSGGRDSIVVIWNTENSSIEWKSKVGEIKDVFFHKSGNHLLYELINPQTDNFEIRLIDLVSKSLTASFRGYISIDKKHLIELSSSKSAKIISLSDLSVIKVLEEDTKESENEAQLSSSRKADYELLDEMIIKRKIPSVEYFNFCLLNNDLLLSNQGVFDNEVESYINNLDWGKLVAISSDQKFAITLKDEKVHVSCIELDCIKRTAYKFSLKELYDAGVQLEPEDVKYIE